MEFGFYPKIDQWLSRKYTATLWPKAARRGTNSGDKWILKTKNVLRFKINRRSIILQDLILKSSSHTVSLAVDDELFDLDKLMFLLDNESATEIVFGLYDRYETYSIIFQR